MRILSGLAAIALVLGAGLSPAAAWDMSGKKKLIAHTKDKDIAFGSVTFTPDGDKVKYTVDIDQAVMKEFFLSMTKFRCLDGAEIQCYVPYPYANPKTVSAKDLTWLEHSLLFFWKKPNDYGAKLGNGLYFKLKMTDKGLEGAPEGSTSTRFPRHRPISRRRPTAMPPTAIRSSRARDGWRASGSSKARLPGRSAKPGISPRRDSGHRGATAHVFSCEKQEKRPK